MILLLRRWRVVQSSFIRCQRHYIQPLSQIALNMCVEVSSSHQNKLSLMKNKFDTLIYGTPRTYLSIESQFDLQPRQQEVDDLIAICVAVMGQVLRCIKKWKKRDLLFAKANSTAVTYNPSRLALSLLSAPLATKIFTIPR